MEFKGTEGKWEIMMDGDEIKIIQADSLENGAGWRSYIAICEEVLCIEDANLIAAAPDLLNALQAMLNKAYKQNWNDHYPDEVSKAQSAIRKALGDK
ncbi:hypothetical protein [Escherichia coli]|uniref:hypothetical protein n=1 Tax=Escherichia coli TaxID=562 RepID=UPI002221B579|nr:hypothetical protein [Escherichia coli]UYW83865.1 hypothetical protein N8A72_07390 [Escherichia coli O125ac:K+:H10]